MKKKQDKEIVEVLNTIAFSAKKILKNVKKKETLPLTEAEMLVKRLKAEYQAGSAAE